MTNSTASFVINGVVNIPFSLIAAVGNSLILVSFARTPSLLSPSNVLLISLTISDLLVGLIVQPSYIAEKICQHMNPPMLSRFSRRTLTAVSFLIVSFLSVDRFLAVHLHLRYHEVVTVRRMTLFVCSLWIASAVTASFGIWRAEYFDFVAAPATSIFLLINAVLYFKIYRIVRRHQLQISQQLTTPVSVETINMTARLKSSFFNSFSLYLIFLLCFAPYMGTAVNWFIKKSNNLDPTSPAQLAFEASWTIVFINSSLNPLLYSWRLKNVRAAVKRTLKDISSKLSCFGR